MTDLQDGQDPVAGEASQAVSSFGCPRCGSTVESDFYGPCVECRQVLRATVRADARDVESGAYEPKMNVTPNAVATKE